MVCFHAEILKAFLDINSYRLTPSPQSDDKVRAKPAFKNLYAQAIGIFEQCLFFDILFVHF